MCVRMCIFISIFVWVYIYLCKSGHKLQDEYSELLKIPKLTADVVTN